jgi:hypothetical protein
MMLTPECDADSYPTDATLMAIEQWSHQDMAGCLDFCRAAWHYPDYVSEDISVHEVGVLRAKPQERYLRFATGGWSGNESIIHALQTNRAVWLMTWRLSAYGGVYLFHYPATEPR